MEMGVSCGQVDFSDGSELLAKPADRLQLPLLIACSTHWSNIPRFPWRCTLLTVLRVMVDCFVNSIFCEEEFSRTLNLYSPCETIWCLESVCYPLNYLWLHSTNPFPVSYLWLHSTHPFPVSYLWLHSTHPFEKEVLASCFRCKRPFPGWRRNEEETSDWAKELKVGSRWV